MGKEYRGFSKCGEYVDIEGPSRVVLIGRGKGRAELLIVTEARVGLVEKPIKRPKECEE